MNPETLNIEPHAGLHYNKLHAPVRSYVDNLRAQVYEILHKYGANDMQEFAAKTHHVDLKDRQTVIKLMRNLVTAYQKNESPDGHVIFAEDKDGEGLQFDLNEIREQWDAFYRENNLAELADSLPKEITLTPEQIETLKAKAKEGYTRAILIPTNVDDHLQDLKDNLLSVRISDEVKPSFPNKIQTIDPERIGNAYLLLTNPDEPLQPETKNSTVEELLQKFKAEGLSGLTLAEYIIEESKHFYETQHHLVNWDLGNATLLLASKFSETKTLFAYWSPDVDRIEVKSNWTSHQYSPHSYPNVGARAAVVLPLDL